MKVSLIISTYNRPDALKLTIKSALNQTYKPYEIIIADDGSTQETKKLVEKMKLNSKIPVIHVWQEDKGFRLAMIRNRAIAASKGDYIIIIDGDLILDKHFVYDHVNASKKGLFIQGSRVLLDKELTEKAISNEIMNFNFFSKGLKNRKNAIRSKILSSLFSRITTSIKGIRGCNISLYKEDILAVNGFDNTFVGWGREDSEFAVRLINKGILRKNLKFSAVAYHLYHPENSRKSLPENDMKLKKSIEKKLKWCEDGIDRFLKKE